MNSTTYAEELIRLHLSNMHSKKLEKNILIVYTPENNFQLNRSNHLSWTRLKTLLDRLYICLGFRHMVVRKSLWQDTVGVSIKVCWDSIHTVLAGFLFWIVLFNEVYTIWSNTYAFFLSTCFACISGPLPVFLSQSLCISLCIMILLHCNQFFLTFFHAYFHSAFFFFFIYFF